MEQGHPQQQASGRPVRRLPYSASFTDSHRCSECPLLDANSKPGVSYLGEMRTRVGEQMREIIVSGEVLGHRAEECPVLTEADGSFLG